MFRRPKKILVNSATNTINMANVATNTITTEELLAPLASMEDLSVLMTPMSTPGYNGTFNPQIFDSFALWPNMPKKVHYKFFCVS